jgi:hypothetical protein
VLGVPWNFRLLDYPLDGATGKHIVPAHVLNLFERAVWSVWDAGTLRLFGRSPPALAGCRNTGSRGPIGRMDAETRLQWLMVSVSIGFLGALVFLPMADERKTEPVTSAEACVVDEHCPKQEVARSSAERSLETTRRVDAGWHPRNP